jgi:hypothetical protein
MKDLINVFIDSDITAPVGSGKRMDGVLPVLMETKVLTNILKLLVSEANDRDDLFSSLEQITGAVRFTKGELTAINQPADSAKKIPFPEWMFAQGTGADEFGFYTGFNDVRDEDLVLDVGIDRLVGHLTFAAPDGTVHKGYGLTNYVAEQENKNWSDFDRDMDALEDLLHPDSPYSLTKSFIAMQDAVFARDAVYPSDEIAGFLYSVGKLFTRYDTAQNRWVVQGDPGFNDLYNILKLRIPALHNLIKDDTGANYSAFLTINEDLMKEQNECCNSGLVPYLLDAMSTDDGSKQIISDLYTFLKDPLVSEPAPLWSCLADLLEDLSDSVNDAKDGSLMVKVFQSYGFQQNGPYEKIVNTVKKTYHSIVNGAEDMFSGIVGY